MRFNLFKLFFESSLAAMNLSKQLKTLIADDLIIFHLLKLLSVNLAFNSKSGIFSFLISNKKFGQISLSTNNTIDGFHPF